MRPRLLSIALVLALAAQAVALAGTTGKITGEVKDSQTGEPLVGANIVVQGTTIGAATNIEGYYVILNVPPGTYSIVASGVGYNKELVTGVKVSVDLTTTLDFKMRSTVVEVGEVTVTAEARTVKKDLTSAESRVDASQIATLPVKEVGEVLTLQAGVTQDRGGGLHIRGGRTSEVAYWVDGVSVSDGYDGGQAVQIDNLSVQELQVISGTFNAEYGQAMSGIVNIVTKDGDQTFRGTLSSYIGSYYTKDGIYYNQGNLRPLDIKNVEGSVSGPVPGTGLTFYASGRWLHDNGYLYGQRTFNPDGSLAPGADTIKGSNGEFLGISRPNSPVPMNDRERFSGQAKLSYAFGGWGKFSLTFAGSKINYRDYNHDYFLAPDGDVSKHDNGFNFVGVWTHTITPTSFYTLNASYFKKSFREYLYQDVMDSRYVLDPTIFNKNLYEYNHGGTNNHQFKRDTETRTAKLDYTNQIDRLHQIKVGLEGRLHRLYLEDYSVVDTTRSNGVLVNVDHKPDPYGPLYLEYTEQPIEFSAYIQDKLEYERMIVNIGLRYDYFNSRGKVLTDLQDPNVYLPQKPENKALTLDERLAKWYKNANVYTMWSPRFGISYPITDRGILHFSYGWFLQIPQMSLLFQNPGYKVDAVTPIQGVYGNPDLKPQRTIMYEIGLQQEITSSMNFDVTGFYRDIRNWVTTSPQIPVRDPSTATVYYTMFINQDYGNSRGITFTLTKRPIDLLTVNFAYTFQVVEGNNSNPDEGQSALLANKEPEKQLVPLEWDQTHTVNLTVGVGQRDWGVFVIGQYGSGFPYTPVINQAEARGEDAARVLPKNSRRQPAMYAIDLNLFKTFRFDPIDLNVYVKVFNLLDRRNEVTVYGESGRSTVTTQELGITGLGGFNRINTPEEYLVRPDYYSPPRQILFGVDLNF